MYTPLICVHICECVEFVFTIRLMCFIHDWRANRELALSLISLQSVDFCLQKLSFKFSVSMLQMRAFFCNCRVYATVVVVVVVGFASHFLCVCKFVRFFVILFSTKHIFCTGFITLLSNMFLFWFDSNAAYTKQQPP